MPPDTPATHPAAYSARAPECVALHRAASQGRGNIVAQMIPNASKEALVDALSAAASSNRLQCVALLLPECAHLSFLPRPRLPKDVAERLASTLRLCARNGWTECLAKILPLMDADAKAAALVQGARDGQEGAVALLLADRRLGAPYPITQALAAAAEKGFQACLSRLLSDRSPCDDLGPALVAAAYGGSVESLIALLPLIDASYDDSRALRRAAKEGHDECVQVLAAKCPPDAGAWKALRLAAGRGQQRCSQLLMDLLLPVASGAQMAQVAELARYGAHFSLADLIMVQAESFLLNRDVSSAAPPSSHRPRL